MRRRITASHPILLAALAGTALGLLGAVLLLAFSDPPGSGLLGRTWTVFYTVTLPVSHWLRPLTWPLSLPAQILILMPVNGAAWGIALAALTRRLRGSVRARCIAAGSALAGTVLAVLVGIAGFPELGPYDGVRGLIVVAQAPGIMLLALNGYDTMMYDGTVVGGIYRPGPVTLLLFSLANALLAAWYAVVARFTWRWIRAPMPRPSPVAEG